MPRQFFQRRVVPLWDTMRSFLKSQLGERLMFVGNESIAGFDDEMAEAIKAETLRQEQHIELIASENYVPRVMQAQGRGADQ